MPPMPQKPNVDTTAAEIVIRKEIERHGSINFHDYMALALHHREHGYYRQSAVIGAEADFITAPEISQIFGELIGLWCVDRWQALGEPNDFILMECGPGRGTLMADALRAASMFPAFLSAAQLTFLETNEVLKEQQQRRLHSYNPRFIDNLNDLTQKPPIIAIGNEFLDAFPVRLFKGDSEVQVILDGNNRLALAADQHDSLWREENPAAKGFVKALAGRLSEQTGAALIIDYGTQSPQPGITVQALRKNQHVDLFHKPGESDLTAHVDFQMVRSSAKQGGASAFGPATQGDFLKALGGDERLAQLSTQNPESAEKLEFGYNRLVEPSQMGSLFKAMALQSPGLNTPPGFPPVFPPGNGHG